MRDILKDYKIFNIDPKQSRSSDFYQNMLEYREKVMDQFKDAIKKGEDFVCPLCRQRQGQQYLRLNDYVLYECQNCSLVSPNIDFDKLGEAEVYDDEAYIKDTTREILETYEYRKKTLAPERLNYILEKIPDLTKDNIKLLDVGCGPGYFLSYLKDQEISYKGLELADWLVKTCLERGLNVEPADLAAEPTASYNIIALFDVLEHLKDPISLFKTLNDKLTMSGYVLAYTPNIHSLAYYLMKEQQNTLYPYQHLCFFDPKSLEFLAQATGFQVYSIDYYGLDVMDYFCYKQHEDNFDYLEKLRVFIQVMQAVIDKQNLSNHMRVIFKKA